MPSSLPDLSSLVLSDAGFSFQAQDFQKLMGPIVYAFLRDGVPVYIGRSSRGIGRPAAPTHHKIGSASTTYDTVSIWACPSREAAKELEKYLLDSIQPELNGQMGGVRAQGIAKHMGVAAGTAKRKRIPPQRKWTEKGWVELGQE